MCYLPLPILKIIVGTGAGASILLSIGMLAGILKLIQLSFMSTSNIKISSIMQTNLSSKLSLFSFTFSQFSSFYFLFVGSMDPSKHVAKINLHLVFYQLTLSLLLCFSSSSWDLQSLCLLLPPLFLVNLANRAQLPNQSKICII